MKAWMRLTGEDPLQLVRIRDDAFAYADLRDGFLRLIVIDGDFETDFFRIADALLEAGGEFMDVGANHGLLSFGIARRSGGRVRFHLFEPNPKLQTSIAKSLALYSSMQVQINPMALSDKDGTVLFDVDEQQTGASHITESGALPVPSIRLDTYIKENHLDRVDLVKLDIEGYELTALRGAENALKTRCMKAIYFEYFEKYLVRVGPPSELIDFLDSRDYEVCFCRVADIQTQGVSPTTTIKRGLPGHGLPLIPVRSRKIPAMTDLLALPKENLVGI
jgi:FkbM family methyltransferase